jgi:hypothetical protein
VKALCALGVVAVALGCLQAVEAILGTIQATLMGTVALVLAFVVGGVLWDRNADRRRADRFARPTIRRREIIDVPRRGIDP